ncbi:methyl-accepting chemotaxis protein [Dyella sp. BiH032]|uniref:methyl-accepting chemotaxis protein n=1 Tax=Dyella sp. BiH032 TaxID=3075430 RepID=UPI0028936851|nr:methyl-accepting chemotaxis protein [Dyella sp. BiH032]WNL45612.1 methyl-accepting chemotaxis protein [Dyella sp. BiH032]
MIRYTIKLRMGARLGLLLLFLIAIGLVGIYGIEQANQGAERLYREDVRELATLGRLRAGLESSEERWLAVATGAPIQDRRAEEAPAASSFVPLAAPLEALEERLTAVQAKGDRAAKADLAAQALPLLHTYGEAVRDAWTQRLELADAHHAQVLAQGREIRNAALGVVLFGLLLAVISDGVFVRTMTARIRAALELARTVASGRLDNRIPTLYSDEIGELRTAFREMDEHLSNVIRRVRGSAEAVNAASRELASGNGVLASAMQDQVASLGQTAASMEQMAQHVRRTADSAGEADRLAASAREQAERGGESIERMMHAIAAIDASSHRIADISGEIDGIAFQTNLLALNAAVEAARAGEQGRGFAVVAGEVRALAQRSAAAAREVKRLIGESQSTVAEGAGLVQQSSDDFQRIARSVRKLSDVMAEIAAASEHQAADIGQVSTTVTRMDDHTRRHHDQVQGVRRASQALLDQARMLAGEVEYFRFADGTPRAEA